MKYLSFLIIILVSFALAPMAQVVTGPNLGNCTFEEVREYDAGLQGEACEKGFTFEEARETCASINTDCRLGMTPDQLQSCTAMAYANAIRFANAKVKGVTGVTTAFPNPKTNFDESQERIVGEIERILTEEITTEPDMVQLLKTARDQMLNLPYGLESGASDPAMIQDIEGTIAQFEHYMKTDATLNPDVVGVVTATCVEFESFVTIAHKIAENPQPVESRRMIAHVTLKDGGFNTQVIVDNQSGQARNYRLVAYNQSGLVVEEVSGEVQPHKTLFLDRDELFSASDVSHFIIEEGEGIEMTAVYRSALSGSAAQVKETFEPDVRWRLFPGDWTNVWDGLAIVNMGNKASAISIRQLDDSGEEIRSITIDSLADLAPMGKSLVVLNKLGFDKVAGSQFQLVSSEPIAVTALRGTFGNDYQYLWENLVRAD